MKRAIVLLLLAGLVISLAGCPRTPTPITPESKDTTTATPPPTPKDETPPPPPPKAELRDEQFQTVYFDFDKFNLRADARAALDANFALLSEYGDVIIQIEGHCDERGTVEYNLSLGEKRAKSARDYLVDRGIAAGRITTISYGKERPVDTRSNEEAWAKNRRCEFKIISQ